MKYKDWDLQGLVNVVKNEDEVVKHIEKAFPHVSWLKYKGQLMIPTFGIIKLLGGKGPMFNTDLIEKHLLYTGVIALSKAKDKELLLKSNPHSQYTSMIIRVWNRRGVKYVRLFPPVSALLLLISKDSYGTSILRNNLSITIPKGTGNITILNACREALMKAGMQSKNFYLYGSDGSLLNMTPLEVISNNKDEGDKDNMLVQPNVRDVSPKSNSKYPNVTMATVMALLEHQYSLSESLAEDKRQLIENLKVQVEEHDKDSLQILDKMDTIKKAIEVTESMNIPPSNLVFINE